MVCLFCHTVHRLFRLLMNLIKPKTVCKGPQWVRQWTKMQVGQAFWRIRVAKILNIVKIFKVGPKVRIIINSQPRSWDNQIKVCNYHLWTAKLAYVIRIRKDKMLFLRKLHITPKINLSTLISYFKTQNKVILGLIICN